MAADGTVCAATAGVIGIVVALSSAAIVLKQLSDRGETSIVSGMITTGVLLLQEISVIAIMQAVPKRGNSAEPRILANRT